MTGTVVITQPTYFPWLGYFEQVRQADTFVFLDSVQFERRSWQSRNRLADTSGRPFWLTVPVKGQPRETRIKDVEISIDDAWCTRHRSFVRHSLERSPFLRDIFPLVERMLTEPPSMLAELNMTIIREVAALLGLRTVFLRSSELPVSGRKAQLILNIARHLGASDYYTSAGAAAYLSGHATQFEDAGITLRFQDWKHPHYPRGIQPFVSHLSVLDALCWMGPDDASRSLETPS